MTAPPVPFQPQRDRLITALLYLGWLLAVSQLVHGHWIPPFAAEGLWFYGGFVPLLLARLLEPWFPRPADVFANGITLVVATSAVTPVNPDIPVPLVEAGRLALASFGGILIFLSAVAMMWRTSPGLAGVVARVSTAIARTLGQSRIVYSLFLAFALLIGQAANPLTIGIIATTWAVVILLRPLETAFALLRRWRPSLLVAGVAIEHEIDPRIIVARARAGDEISLGDQARWEEGGHGIVVDRTELLDGPRLLISTDPGATPPGGAVSLAQAGSNDIVGYVGDSTSLHELVVHATADVRRGSDVAEGRLMSASIREAEVLFQVTSAAIVARTDWTTRRQTLEIRARKLGTWNADEQGFALVPWVPDAGTPVRLIAPTADDPSAASGVGSIPGTGYQIGIRIDSAVLFNTAILGILGVGKTSLAWELIQRMLCDGLRVVAFDITGEYVLRFRDLLDELAEKAIYDGLESRLAPNRTNQGTPKEKAGNWNDLKPAVRELLEKAASTDSRLLVINPSQLDVTAEDGFPQGGVVPLRRLTNVEVVRLIAEEILDYARTTTPADPKDKLRPRMCIVLEEAHSLVPEGGSTADRNEQTATAGTARAILQGRKYGLGCLLITQRTANVTKTILNQCHTVFAMRSFDATSESFLANYLGREYSGLLPSLRDRQAVVFGRPSTSQSPVLVELNDRDKFADEFWKDCLPGVPTTDLNRTELVGETEEFAGDVFEPSQDGDDFFADWGEDELPDEAEL